MVPVSAIKEVGAEWYGRNCVEERANRGVCVDKIHELFDPKWIANKRAEAWCAKFVWVVYEEAAKRAGVANPLPKTAGALTMLNKAKQAGLRVDKNPQDGDVFYRGRPTAKSSGHVGIVTDVKADGITTVEGNLSDRVTYYFYDWDKVKSPAYNFSFIHSADDSQSGGKVVTASTNGLLGLVLIGTAALWYFNSKK